MCELPDDVTLMQIADEQLPPAEHVRWMEIIQKSPELSKRLAAFQETRALGAPYEAEGKIPDRLLDTIRNTPIGGMAAPSRVETETPAPAATRH